jgi:hypothetical protein
VRAAVAEATLVEVFGIRHHGPGSARSLVRALDEFAPDLVLIEGPADADPLVGLVDAEGMEPPVALLAYVPEEPRRAAFWPYAVFSPEWQAMTWAVRRHVPVRFCDLPAAVTLAIEAEHLHPGEPVEDREPAAVRRDPLAALADAAGYDDPERWWDDVVESRLDGGSPFPALVEAMAALREDQPSPARTLSWKSSARRTCDRPSVLASKPVTVVWRSCAGPGTHPRLLSRCLPRPATCASSRESPSARSA